MDTRIRNVIIVCAVLFVAYWANYLIYPSFYKQRPLPTEFGLDSGANHDRIQFMVDEIRAKKEVEYGNAKTEAEAIEKARNKILTKYREEDLANQRGNVLGYCVMIALCFGGLLYRREIWESGAIQKAFEGMSQEVARVKEQKAALKEIEREGAIYQAKAKITPDSTVVLQAELATMAMQLNNELLRQQVNTIAASNAITFGQVDLIKKIVNEVNINAITPAQAFVWVKSLNPTADVNIDMASQELMVREELEAKRADNRKKVAEARREEAQAELDEFTKEETIRPNSKG